MERFALINHPTKGVEKIKIQDSDGFKIPFPKSKDFKKLTQKTQATVKDVILQHYEKSKPTNLYSPSGSQYSGISSLSP